MMKRGSQFVTLSLLTAGCVSATMVSRQYEPVKGGVVKYLDAGADFVINARRRNAVKKMTAFCEGEFKIVRESHDSNMTAYTAMPMVGGATAILPATSEYNHIYFECRASGNGTVVNSEAKGSTRVDPPSH